MARAIWRGAISFSLINIPVSLHAARRPAALDLDLLDKRDFSPVGYQRINKKTGRRFERDDIVKGYSSKRCPRNGGRSSTATPTVTICSSASRRR